MTTKNKWTQHNEDTLQEMLAMKRKVQEENRAPLEVLVGNALGRRDISDEEVVDFLIKNADHVRDLLEPFDSGVRLQP